MIPDFSRTAPSLNDRTKHGGASALRSQAVAKGLMVLPWRLPRAYCCTPLAAPRPPPPAPSAWHIYLHVVQVRASALLALTRTPRISGCARVSGCVRVVRLRIYASGTKPLDVLGATS